MNIKEAKEEIKHTLLAYNRKDAAGRYTFPKLRQRPILLMGPPGIGKTAIMEQVAEECGVGLVAYAITHHTTECGRTAKDRDPVLQRKRGQHHRVYLKRDHCFCV